MTSSADPAVSHDSQSPMTLGAALMAKQELDKVLLNIKDRMFANARAYTGRKPAEAVMPLLRRAESVLEEQRQLVLRINVANQSTRLGSGLAMSEMLSLRENLKTRATLIKELIKKASLEDRLFAGDQDKIEATVDLAALEQEQESLCRQVRDINLEIQQANWQITI